jgi:hypothetical protein
VAAFFGKAQAKGFAESLGRAGYNSNFFVKHHG